MKTNGKTQMAMFVALAAAAAMFTSCKKDNNNMTTSSPGTYNMYMTDAPANYQQVNVNIVGAEVNSGTSGWIALKVNAGIYNLLNFSNGKDTLIASGQVSGSTVTQVRLLLGSTGNTVMVNNTLYPLQTPSADQSGLKVDVSSNMSGTASNTVVLDFDAGMSVVATGSGSYILKPVIRADIAPANGSIQGTISPLGSPSTIIAINGDSASTFSSTLTGGFMVQGLASGTYTVVILPPPPYTIKTVTGVNVTSGQATSMGTITLQ